MIAKRGREAPPPPAAVSHWKRRAVITRYNVSIICAAAERPRDYFCVRIKLIQYRVLQVLRCARPRIDRANFFLFASNGTILCILRAGGGRHPPNICAFGRGSHQMHRVTYWYVWFKYDPLKTSILNIILAYRHFLGRRKVVKKGQFYWYFWLFFGIKNNFFW
jgi:hypothetical protein